MTVRAFLNVEASLTGRRWIGPSDEEDRLAEAMAQQTRLPMALCYTLVKRGVAPAEAVTYLSPTLRDLLPDPLTLYDMGKAASRFLVAFKARQRIAVFADYDVDGATSAALIILWLRAMGHDATLYIPDRIDEGYGPNVPAMLVLAGTHDLIICVDCGTLSHEPVAAAVSAGSDVVVLDHHLGADKLPPALAIVNPNRKDEDGALGHLCAASVVFLMLVEVNRQLRDEGVSGPDLMAMLDLVALATVADVAPLIGVNRALVRQGLKVMARRERIGLRVLADVSRLDTAPTCHSLGFLFGPRVNAGGRIGQADLGARLLCCNDEHEAEALAQRLDDLNTERRDIEARVCEEALAQAEARGFDAPLVWAAAQGWHPGVVGIVAGRLKEVTNRPAIVIGFEDGIGKGSGRSVSGIDLGASIHRLAEEGLLIKGGGHRMAAGLTVAEDALEAAMARLSELLARQGAGTGGAADLKLDGLLMPSAADLALVKKLEEAGPFGASSPAPRFAFADMAVIARRIGEKHLRLTIRDGTGGRLEGVAFSAFDTALGPALLEGGHTRFHLSGRLELNTWNGKTKVQLRVEDAARTKDV
ncbi:MAG: single-stranded-DNA-specific exonuclease RecJ [Rhodobacteraceae bacterium]|nr:single-stranded-DNA-specific exonuclease RecJ [Paracoccaceae bacterium]